MTDEKAKPLNKSEIMREFYKQNPNASAKEAAAAAGATTDMAYIVRRQMFGSKKKKAKPRNIALKPLTPGISTVRKVITDQTVEVDSLKKSLSHALDEIKGYRVLIGYFEWQIGLRDSRGNRGTTV
jgi:hypothetical protein